MMKKILFVFGTRPEAIKLAPLILEAKKDKKLKTFLVSSGQHREILDSVTDLFKIKIDYDLKIMKRNQTLSEMTARILTKISPLIEKIKPNIIIVQGDTTTAFIGVLAGYYHQTPLAHIEAGLRSFDKYQPFPEEINRRLISTMADFHFAPTEQAKANLLLENEKAKNIFVVGNTVIDALKLVSGKVFQFKDKKVKNLKLKSKYILVTTHRRENLGKPMKNIASAILQIARHHPEIEFVIPMHPNPKVREVLTKILDKNKKIHLIEPLNYPDFVLAMKKSYLILTDSGGVQEEAPSLGKPVLVMRETTERPEGVATGTAILVGTDPKKIVTVASKLISNKTFYQKISLRKNPYGDGRSSQRILKILKAKLS